MNWLDEVKKYLGLLITTEVTEIKYLERISMTADILQIGSRNMQNLELLKEIAKLNKPIILKRHFGASIRDLLGAAEHILVEGNNKLILCERGVSIPHTHRETSRFALDIQAIPALKEICSFPIISDPSHASFWAPWVEPLALASVAAGCDGLIIEMHPDPKNSAVDPLQPLNFKQFSDLKNKITKLSKIVNKKITLMYCGIIGYPLKNPRSIKIWKKIFLKKKINCKMIPIEIKPKDFSKKMDDLKNDLNFQAAAITMPYKEKVHKLILPKDSFSLKAKG